MTDVSVGPSRGIRIGRVPALMATPVRDRDHHRGPLPTVLWFHGFRADALAHAREIEACAARGLLSVAIDAVDHGARANPALMARMQAEGGAMPVMLDVISRTLEELPGVIDELVSAHGADHARVSVVGISMGAFLAYRAIAAGLPLRSAVALLGAPDAQDLPASYCEVPLLSITAEHDVNVPPFGARALHAALNAYPESTAPHRHHVLRGSGHLTSAKHWGEAMSETMAWLERYG